MTGRISPQHESKRLQGPATFCLVCSANAETRIKNTKKNPRVTPMLFASRARMAHGGGTASRHAMVTGHAVRQFPGLTQHVEYVTSSLEGAVRRVPSPWAVAAEVLAWTQTPMLHRHHQKAFLLPQPSWLHQRLQPSSPLPQLASDALFPHHYDKNIHKQYENAPGGKTHQHICGFETRNA